MMRKIESKIINSVQAEHRKAEIVEKFLAYITSLEIPEEQKELLRQSCEKVQKDYKKDFEELFAEIRLFYLEEAGSEVREEVVAMEAIVEICSQNELLPEDVQLGLFDFVNSLK